MKTAKNGITNNGIHGQTTHGKSGRRIKGKRVGVSPEYRAWQNMKDRCNGSSGSGWKYYRERGITVVERWLKFENFYEDMGDRPSPSHSIERKDNNGNYSPENCIWADKKRQGRNRRNNHLETYDGITLSLAEWSERYSVPYTTLRARLNILHWPIHRALTQSVRVW